MRISYCSSDVCSSDLLNESFLAAVIPEFTHFILEAESLFTTQLLDESFAGFLILLFKAALLENPGDGILSCFDCSSPSRVGASTFETSEERRVGTACVSTCGSRWPPYH